MLVGTHGSGQGWVKRVFPDGQDKYDSSLVVSQIQNVCLPELKLGYDPFFSIKPPINGTAAQWDKDIAAVSVAVNTMLGQYPGHNIYMTVWHEPEDNMSAASFIKVFAYWYTGMKNSLFTNPRFQMGPVNMAYQQARVASPGSWVPVASDFRGLDIYSHTTLDKGGRLTDHPGWKRWLPTVPDKSKIFLVERGFDLPTDADQLNTLNDDYALLKSYGAYGYLYWNTPANGHAYPLGLNSSVELGKIAVTEFGLPVTPPTTFTQADVDEAYQTGYNDGKDVGYSAGHDDGEVAAYHDVATWSNTQADIIALGQQQ